MLWSRTSSPLVQENLNLNSSWCLRAMSSCQQFYRVIFSNGPTQKSSKYGSGPIQQDKKCTGPTQRSSDVRVVNNQFLLVAVVGGVFEGRKL